MGKREALELDATANVLLSAKRQKLSADEAKPASSLTAAADLLQLTVFDQSNPSGLVSNLRKLRLYVARINQDENEQSCSERRLIFLEFLKSVTPKPDDRTSLSISDLFLAWSFAVETSHDGLLSAVPSFLAALLQVVSSLLDFRQIGVELCYSILSRDSLRAIDRSLESFRSKSHPASLCVSLLTEVVSFDGGACARNLYRHRYVTWNRLPWLLGRISGHQRPAKQDLSSPLRRVSLKYILANLRCQSVFAREDLLSMPGLTMAVFRDLSHDPADLVVETLETFRDHVILDDDILQTTKKAILSEKTLAQIGELYRYRSRGIDAAIAKVHEACHTFLLKVCTNKECGILVDQSGWYPPTFEAATSFSTTNSTELVTVDSERQPESVIVRNKTLSSFINTLRPHTDLRQRQLVLEIFKAAPELIADYFLARRSIPFDPALNAAWIGQAAFLAAILELPRVPPEKFINGQVRRPAPTHVLLGNILPKSLTQAALTKCLNQNYALIKLLATRLIILALRRASSISSSFKGGQIAAQWNDAEQKLMTDLCHRLPNMRHLNAALRGCPEETSMLKQSLTLAMSLYVKVLPNTALQGSFDVSVALAEALLSSPAPPADSLTFKDLELENYVEIVYQSTEMRWWNGPEKLHFSPFMVILRSDALSGANAKDRSRVSSLLHSVATESHVLQQNVFVDSYTALASSLRPTATWRLLDVVFDFIDNCCQRVVKRPVKYFGDARQYSEASGYRHSSEQTSLLFTVAVEQWPFLIERHSSDEVECCAVWLSRFMAAAIQVGECQTSLQQIRNALIKLSASHPVKNAFNNLPQNTVEKHNTDLDCSNIAGTVRASMVSEQASLRLHLDQALQPSREAEDHPALHQWQRKDIADAIDEGFLAKLVLCLCSSYEEVRRQALINIRLCMTRMQGPDQSEWEQTYLLMGELAETAQEDIQTGALASFAGELAANSFAILSNPLHVMFTKLNEFLNKGPSWNVSRLPSYWIDKILHQPPELDDEHAAETQWLLKILISGLQTTRDIDIYRRCGVFERAMSLCTMPTLGPACREKVVHLLYRCACVEGSTMLVTRCGVLGWIRERSTKEVPHLVQLLQCLASKLLETCDVTRLEAWCGLEGRRVLSLFGDLT